MPLLVVGSVALDSVKTPHGEVSDALGGSATYFSFAARLLSPVRMVGVVGQDFPKEHVKLLQERGIDLTDLQVTDGQTFRWSGAYDGDMAVAETLDTQLNVFADFDPQLSEASLQSRALFLANIHPSLQRRVRAQMQGAEVVFCDTMNLWIETASGELEALLREVNGAVLNDQEARMLTGEANLVRAGKAMLEMGPEWVIVKKGEHGAMVFGHEGVCSLPAYPLETVADPTGAGDSFAGGMMGYLASSGENLSMKQLKRAVAHGIVISSFCCEDFSLERMKRVQRSDVDERLVQYGELLSL